MGKLSMSEKNHKSLWALISQSIKWKQFCNTNKSLMLSDNTYRMCYYDYNLLSHYYTKDLFLHFFLTLQYTMVKLYTTKSKEFCSCYCESDPGPKAAGDMFLLCNTAS